MWVWLASQGVFPNQRGFMYSEGPFLSKVKQNTAKKNTSASTCTLKRQSFIESRWRQRTNMNFTCSCYTEFLLNSDLKACPEELLPTEPAHQSTTFFNPSPRKFKHIHVARIPALLDSATSAHKGNKYGKRSASPFPHSADQSLT